MSEETEVSQPHNPDRFRIATSIIIVFLVLALIATNFATIRQSFEEFTAPGAACSWPETPVGGSETMRPLTGVLTPASPGFAGYEQMGGTVTLPENDGVVIYSHFVLEDGQWRVAIDRKISRLSMPVVVSVTQLGKYIVGYGVTNLMFANSVSGITRGLEFFAYQSSWKLSQQSFSGLPTSDQCTWFDSSTIKQSYSRQCHIPVDDPAKSARQFGRVKQFTTYENVALPKRDELSPNVTLVYIQRVEGKYLSSPASLYVGVLGRGNVFDYEQMHLEPSVVGYYLFDKNGGDTQLVGQAMVSLEYQAATVLGLRASDAELEESYLQPEMACNTFK